VDEAVPEVDEELAGASKTRAKGQYIFFLTKEKPTKINDTKSKYCIPYHGCLRLPCQTNW
jgi:hypothetical protein